MIDSLQALLIVVFVLVPGYVCDQTYRKIVGERTVDSAVQVMTAPFAAKQLIVRWPGGKLTTGDLPAGAREVTVDDAGKIIRQR